MPGLNALVSRVAFSLLMLVVLALAANYLAGMLCLLLFSQDPFSVQISTFWYAWSHTSATSHAAAKVRLAGLGGLAGAVLPFFLMWITRRPTNPDVHGQARFASEKEIDRQGFFGPLGLIVGRYGKRLLRFPGSEFVLLSAPTRSGKGVSTVIPTLLTFEGSVVVLDIKGENYQITSQYRATELGNRVVYFNPFAESSHRWNPLSYVSADPRAMPRDLMALAVIVFPDDPKNPFFSHSARNMFVALGLLVLETPQLPPTMGEILRQASGKGQSLKAYLGQVQQTRRELGQPLSDQCQDAFNRLLQNSEDTLKNIQASFVAPLAIWMSPLVDKATSGNDLDLRELRRTPTTVYLHVPANEVVQAGLILNLFFSQLINENVKVLPESDPSLKYPCLLLLDEFTAIGKVSVLAKAVGFIAGYNLRLLIVIQDKAQLVATYGKDDAQNIISNMGLVISFTPKQLEEAEQLSKMIGDRTVKIRSVQHANVGLLNTGKYAESITESEQKRAVMLPQELLAMDARRALLIRQGIPVVSAEKVNYFTDPYFMNRLARVAHTTWQTGSAVRQVPVALPLPQVQWEVFQHQLASSDHYLHLASSDPAQGVSPHPHASLAATLAPTGANAFQPEALAQEFLSRYLSSQTA